MVLIHCISAGYKISALEIERALLEHTDVQEVVVFGQPSDVYGERIAAVILTKSGEDLSLTEVRKWASAALARLADALRRRLLHYAYKITFV